MDKNEYYTPPEIADLVREALGSINLDPFSCEQANILVKADRFFSAEDNGFRQKWECENLYMNPMFSYGYFPRCVEKFMTELVIGSFKRAIVLTNNNPETVAGHRLLSACSAICLPKGRLSFYNEDLVQETENRNNQIIYFFGEDLFWNINPFRKAFQKIGQVFVKP